MDQYAVIGHPIAHSKSPRIHAAFASQTAQPLEYQALLAPLDGFVAAVQAFRAAGGLGMNVTVPFKLEAFALADRHTARAQTAGAVNTLAFDESGILGDNTDGAGLVRDLVHNLQCPLAGRRILLLGAGGAARGAMLPLLQAAPSSLTLANRTESKAAELVRTFGHYAGAIELHASSYCALAGAQFDVVINATSASLAAEAPPLPDGIYAQDALAYDMMYGSSDTAYMQSARAAGASRVADGLGMLVEQAAESFALWRGVRPLTAPVLTALRNELRPA
ncbi:shikimate dehydrogenase [Azoarcus sp. L1K30]|uniref:shikimate dehydrogenase n=1 Tax=Azoarcus sp. L1K30 TaxID=2820277 RepID=UPI001B834A72|nr:shikimate dehydrogenase [Azoarcus sp. L1K30]MBR0567809.1 shikimate dehydrogenase [Azoarcus sp. L1K30]